MPVLQEARRVREVTYSIGLSIRKNSEQTDWIGKGVMRIYPNSIYKQIKAAMVQKAYEDDLPKILRIRLNPSVLKLIK